MRLPFFIYKVNKTDCTPTSGLGIFYTMFHKIIIILIALMHVGLFGQSHDRDYQKELQFQSKAVESLKREIAATRERIQNEANREKSAARRISDLSEEISLLDRLIGEIKKEAQRPRAEISKLEGRLLANKQELDNLRERYEKRVVATYKRGKLSSLEKVLSSTTWRQAVYRTKYLKVISDIEQQMQKRIRSLLVNIGQDKLKLEAAMRRNIALKREQEQQRKFIRQKKVVKEKELRKIRESQSELANYLNEKKAGLKQLEEVQRKILQDKARFERAERIKRQQQALRTKSFSELKGKLPWPAGGRVVAKFGRQWNSKLKTTTENPGIDIKGKPGSEIRTVLNGVVTTITYIRGYGTTIIVDHGGGFYTVYSHVTNIQTNVDSEVRAGDVIAYMGDSGSVNGSMLHFEIWGKSQKLNPEKWLQKK